MRTALGILVGAALAAGTLAGCGWLLTQRLHPLPAGFEPQSLQAACEYMRNAPVALLVVACSFGAAALVGAWPAARIARNRGAAALWVGAPLTVLALAGTALVPQPDWAPILAMLLPIPMAVAAWRLAIPRREL